jgi:hypothetical protein
MAVVRAGAFAVASAGLAVASYHFVFGGMPSLSAGVLAVAGLFCAAVPRAAHSASVWRWLAVVCGGQAAACWWFHLASGGAPGTTRDNWLLIPVHAHRPLILLQLALTLLVACMLHGADAACRGLLRNVGRELHHIRGYLRRLLHPVSVPLTRALPQPGPHRSPGPARASPPHAFLADVVVRRGPPPRLPLAVRPC